MLEFYQSKLNVVTMVVEKLKEVKEQKRKEISSASRRNQQTCNHYTHETSHESQVYTNRKMI
jgi:hypothetical protein